MWEKALEEEAKLLDGLNALNQAAKGLHSSKISSRQAECNEVRKRNAAIESDYNDMKGEFFKISSIINDLADVLDADFPQYVIEEDKSHKFMILQK